MDDQDKYSSHLNPLALILSQVPREGLVVEFGGGYFSTSMLNMFAHSRGFKAETYDADADFRDHLKRYQSHRHHIWPIDGDTWEDITERVCKRTPYMAFIDVGNFDIDGEQVSRRGDILARVIDYSEYVICHDTEPGWSHQFYGWDFSGIQNVKHFVDIGVRTTICSRFVPVDRIIYTDGAMEEHGN